MKQNYTAKLTEDVSFEKYLNESFQRLYEYYHKLTDFVEFINQTTNYVDDYSVYKTAYKLKITNRNKYQK